jgi:hypothetical protein
MRCSFLTVISVIAVFLLSGCAWRPPELPEYINPSAQSGVTASLTGSQEDSVFNDNTTAYISNIDAARVAVGRKGWNVPLLITEGTHNLIVSLRKGQYFLQANLSLTVVKGAQYQLRFSNDSGFLGNFSYCDFWVVDLATGKTVTDISRAVVSASGGIGPILIPTHR